MTTKQLEKIYQSACQAKGYEPNDGQFKIWKQVLGWCEESDLSNALTAWFAENTNFPMPAELKSLAGHAMRERQRRSSVPRMLVIWECPSCRKTLTGFLEHAANSYRYCDRIVGRDGGGNPLSCNAEMVVMRDERAKETA